MRYLNITLINYIGIYNGMGINEISIDFTKCRTNKILISGINGAGKSTLMKAINLFPDSNSDFIPDKEARKIIDVIDEGMIYRIQYIHPYKNSRSTTKAYIAKYIDGEFIEMNPNGNVTSCKDILMEEFNIDANFLAISSLSSDDRGLVDKKPFDRKKIVSAILPNLSTYSTIHKTISKKMIGFKAIMQDIKGKIDSLGNPIELEAELANTSTIASNIDAERVNIISTLGSLRSKVNELVDILSSNNYDDIVRELEDVSNFVRSCQNSIKRKIQDYGISDVSKLSEFITSLDAKIVENEINKQNAIRDNQKLLSDREHEFSQLQEKQTKLQSLQSEYSYEDVLQEREKLIGVISKCEEVFNKMRLLNIEQITSSEFEYAMESLIELKDMAFNIVSECGIDVLRRVVGGQEPIYNIDDIRSQIINIEEEQHQLSSDISLYKTMRGSISDLDKRPRDCTISSCPFIESFLDIDIKYPKSVLDDMIEKSNMNSITLSSLRDILEDLEQYDIARRYLSNLSKELHSRMKFISKLPIRKDFESTFIDRLLNGDVFKDIDDMYSWVDQANLIEIYKKAKEQYIIYDSQYQVYKSKETIIESLIVDVKNLSDKLDKMDEELDANSNLIRILNTSLEDDRSMRQKASSLLADIEKDLNPSLEKMNQLQEKKNSFDSINIRLKQLNSDVAQNQSRLIILEEQFNKVSEKKESIRRAIALIKDYKNQLQTYTTNYGLLETIKYYSAPTTGISTVYIQIYMNNILNNANALLCTLFDGEFILQPFIIDENEFKIPCVGSGLPHDDVSSMSSAQRSMISTIIQASMLMASQSKYNILKLDEIDGALDSSNRSSFSNIIDRFMTMLNCEQIFIISHNSELDTSSMDIISLKGSDNMYGNIIWKY